MKYLVATSILLPVAYAHGVLYMVKGANGVNAPGSCVMDGVPRDCIVNACGAQADTGIIRDAEIDRGKFGPLGWTQGGGDCKPDAVIGEYMGLSTAPKYSGGRKSTGAKDPFEEEAGKKRRHERRHERRQAHDEHVESLFRRQGFLNLPLVGFLGLGGERKTYKEETIVGDYAGWGKDHGLPTTDDSGKLSLIYRQVNQDGPGPLSAAVDGTSAGTDPKAFKTARVIQNAPGDGFVGLSLATNTNFAMVIQVPDDVVCQGEVTGRNDVCFIRIRNNAPAGPFGGAGFFTKSSAAQKRAVALRMKKRAEAEVEA
ncbi:hypothetical protein PWT90_10646 [Aphanocladium album]|nr:hypothetical protein PWT90_10646 [Aphanocladium album]